MKKLEQKTRNKQKVLAFEIIALPELKMRKLERDPRKQRGPPRRTISFGSVETEYAESQLYKIDSEFA